VKARALVAALAALAALGCAESRCVSAYAAVDDEKWPIPPGASKDCIESAQIATRWCVPQMSDPVATGRCTRAQWDYVKYCKQ
jgi:hypothetical protein